VTIHFDTNSTTPVIVAYVVVAVGCVTNGPSAADSSGVDAGSVADGGQADAGAPPICSPCRAMDYDECFADLRCEAIQIWGTFPRACPEDDRGFSSTCISAFVGCRQRGLGATTCITDAEYMATCASCDWGLASVDELGCRQCEPCSPTTAVLRFVAPCAVASLCRESPTASACTDAGVWPVPDGAAPRPDGG